MGHWKRRWNRLMPPLPNLLLKMPLSAPLTRINPIGNRSSDGSLFLTLPTRALTGQAVMPSEG